MKKMHVIKNAETGNYLAVIQVGRTGAQEPITWTKYKNYACHFENQDEAEATITFIGAVLDWELEEQLEIYQSTGEG